MWDHLTPSIASTLCKQISHIRRTYTRRKRGENIFVDIALHHHQLMLPPVRQNIYHRYSQQRQTKRFNPKENIFKADDSSLSTIYCCALILWFISTVLVSSSYAFFTAIELSSRVVFRDYLCGAKWVSNMICWKVVEKLSGKLNNDRKYFNVAATIAVQWLTELSINYITLLVVSNVLELESESLTILTICLCDLIHERSPIPFKTSSADNLTWKLRFTTDEDDRELITSL